MATRTRRPIHTTIKDLLASLGGVPPARVRLDPPPGTATEKDVLRLYEDHKRLYELVDGTLVEKVMGAKESSIAMYIGYLLLTYSEQNGDLGMVLGEAGTIRLLKKLVRIPDVSFTFWDRLPNRKVPSQPIPDLAPDLAVEVLSRKNTRREMARKLKEYFLSGVRLVWMVDPKGKTVRAFASPDDVTTLGLDDVLDGGDVLPGFAVPVSELFAALGDDPPPARKPRKRKK